jgi:DNA-binding GntR family transcriptional regulator
VSPLLTKQEFTDMFDMRLLLEGASARWAAERADDATRDAIVAESKLAAPALLPYAQSGATGDEHRRIAAAIRAADPDAAEAAMHAHLTEARKRHLVAFD